MYNKKQIMTRAHILHKHRPDHTFGSMLYYAWYFERDFRRLLSSQPVRFTYRKRDGSIREAVGTLNFDLIPSEHLPKALSGASDVRPKSASVFPYFDLDKNEWRSFSVLNFISLDNAWQFNDPLPFGIPLFR